MGGKKRINSMRNENKISIIIPASNAEESIVRCISSIYNNNYTYIECIVVVNNSSDNTMIICEKLKKQYSNLLVIKASAKGVSEARNIGLSYASGSLIGFCDADDYYEPYAIDTIIDKFEKFSLDIVITEIYRTKIENNQIKKSNPSVIFHDEIITVKQARGLVLNNREVMGSVCNKFYKKEIITGIMFDEELTHCEDTYYNMQILKNNNLRIMLADLISYNYVINHSSATRAIDRCYNKEGKLKYLIAIEQIKHDYAGNNHVQKEASYKIAELSIDNYSRRLSRERKIILKKYIKSNCPFLFYGLSRYGFKRNVKRIMKCILIILHII